MKKIVSLVIMVLCWMGSVWGQTLDVKVVQCDNTKGNLIVKIEEISAAAPYSYTVQVSRPGTGFSALSKSFTDNDEFIVFEDLPPHGTQPFTVTVSALGLNGTGFIRSGFGLHVAVETVTPNVDCPERPEYSKLTVVGSGGTYPYTFYAKRGTEPPIVLEEPDDEKFPNIRAFTNLSREGIKEWEVYIIDANGCQSVSKTEELYDYTPIVEGSLKWSTVDANCNGEDGKWIFNSVDGGSQGHFSFVIGKNGVWDWYSETDDVEIPLAPSDIIYTIRFFDDESCPIDSEPFTITQPDPVKFEAEVLTDVSCNSGSDGIIEVKVTGGSGTYNNPVISPPVAGAVISDRTVGAYTYFLIEGLPEGDYTISITDSEGCPGAPEELGGDEISVSEPDELEIIGLVKITKATCEFVADGTISFTVIGGIGPYKYYLDSEEITPGGANDQPVFSVTGSALGTTYVIEVEDAKECTLSISPTVFLAKPIIIDHPNVRTDPHPITCSTDAGNVSIIVPVDDYDDDPELGGVKGYIWNGEELTWVEKGVFNEITDEMVFSGLGEVGSTEYYIWLKYDKDKSINPTGCHDDAAYKHTITIPDPIEFTAAITEEIICYGGVATIEVAVKGGTKPYKDPVISPAVVGSTVKLVGTDSDGTYTYFLIEGIPADENPYSISIKDSNDCPGAPEEPGENVIEVVQPPKLEIDVATTKATCESVPDGTISVTVVGGVEPYKFHILQEAQEDGSAVVGTPFENEYPKDIEDADKKEHTFELLPPGIYKITVEDAKGCPQSESKTVALAKSITLKSIVTDPGLITCSTYADNVTIVATIDDFDPDMGGVEGYIYNMKEDRWDKKGGFEETPVPIEFIELGEVGSTEYYLWFKYAQDESVLPNVCHLAFLYPITIPAPIEFEAEITEQLSCFNSADGEITVTANPKTGYQHVDATFLYSKDGGVNWQSSNIFTDLGRGTYEITVTKRFNSIDCLAPATMEFTLVPPPEIVISEKETYSTNITCPDPANAVDGTITVVAEAGDLDLEYSLLKKDGGSYDPDDPEDTNNDGFFEGLDEGDYIVRVSVSGAPSCFKETVEMTITRADPIDFVLKPDNLELACAESTGTVTVDINTPTPENEMFLYRWYPSTETPSEDDYWVNYIVSTEPDNNSFTVTGEHDEYTVEVAYANGKTCTGHDKKTLTITLYALDFDLTPTHIVCAGALTGRITITNSIDPNVQFTLTRLPDGVPMPFPAGQMTYTGLSGGTYRVTGTLGGCSVFKDITINQPLPITIDDVIIIPPSCSDSNDGQIRIFATGGNEPLRYQIKTDNPNWPGSGNQFEPVHIETDDDSDGFVLFTNLQPDVKWYIEVFDNVLSCGSTTTYDDVTAAFFIIEAPDPLSAVIPDEPDFVSHVSCYGESDGSAKVVVSGGSGRFWYVWKDENGVTIAEGEGESYGEIDGLPFGTYTVTVTDLICHDDVVAEIAIEQPQPLVFNVEKTDIACADAKGTITVTVSGGRPTMTGGIPNYIITTIPALTPGIPTATHNEGEWAYLFSGLEKGVYTISVADKSSGGCNAEGSLFGVSVMDDKVDVEIIEDNLTITDFQAGVLCYGDAGNISLTVSGGNAPYYIRIFEGNTLVEEMEGVLPNEAKFFNISMDGIEEGVTKIYAIEVEDQEGCTVYRSVPMRIPYELKVSLTVDGNPCSLPVTLGRIITGQNQGNLSIQWFLNGFELMEYNNIAPIVANAPGEYYAIVKDDYCVAQSEPVILYQNQPLDYSEYIAIGVTCPEDETGSIEIVNPTGGIVGSTYEYHVFKRDETEPLLVSNSEMISNLGRGEYFIIMSLDPSDVCSSLELRIPRDENEFIVIGANLEIDQNITVTPACENESRKTSIEFLVAWNNGVGNISVMLIFNGKVYYPLQVGYDDGKWKYMAELEGSGEATIIVADGSDCPVEVTVTVPESLSYSWAPTDDTCNEVSDVVFTFAGGEAPYRIEFVGGATYTSQDDENSLEVTNLQAGVEYHVNISDAMNCPFPLTETILLPEPVNFQAIFPDIIDASCNEGTADGSIKFDPDLVDNTYKFLWDNGSDSYERLNIVAGEYEVKVSNFDGSCAEPYTLEVGFANNVVANISNSEFDAYFCPEQIMFFEGNVYASGRDQATPTAEWILPDGEKEEWQAGVYFERPATQGLVTLTATIAVPGGVCSSSDQINVILYDSPTISLADDIIYIPKGIVDYELHVDAGNFDEYLWTVSNPEQIPSLPQMPDPPSPVVLASPNDAYELILTLKKGDCITEHTFVVDYALDLFIPNVFTPNSAEPNNTWKFREIDKWMTIFDIRVEVFSRNGALVYSANGYNNSSVVWDGRRNGENVPINTYYYIVTLVPKSTSRVTPPRPITGWVTIMR